MEDNPDLMEHSAWNIMVEDLGSQLPRMSDIDQLSESLRFVLVYESDNSQLLSLLEAGFKANLHKLDIHRALDIMGVLHSLLPDSNSPFVPLILGYLKSQVHDMSAEELSHFLVPFAFYDSFHDKIFLS